MGFVESEALRRHWYPVAESVDVAPGPLSVRLLGADYVVWRLDDRIFAAPDRCPHREAPLSIGSVTDGALRCAYHGWGFGADGVCVDVPSSGQSSAVPPASRMAACRARGSSW